jgi:hypothetical protein
VCGGAGAPERVERRVLAAPGAVRVAGRALPERIWETRPVETDCR